MSNDYYDKHGKDFADTTRQLDVAPLMGDFLHLLPAGGHILDAGCGSGRDTKAFAELGYKVTAIDSSPSMVSMAAQFSGQQVLQLSFQEIDFHETFDGIWACASLLHVPQSEIGDVLARLTTALKPGAVMYASFKYGTFEGERNGRHFNDFTEEKLTRLLAGERRLELVKMWVTDDVRPERAGERWLNVLVRRRPR